VHLSFKSILDVVLLRKDALDEIIMDMVRLICCLLSEGAAAGCGPMSRYILAGVSRLF
jgi:hypothetical protein